MEKIFNLFVFVNSGMIQEIGAVSHMIKGSDGRKMKYLQSQVISDFRSAKHYPVPNRYISLSSENKGVNGQLSYNSFHILMAHGRQLELFEEVFVDMGAPANPLYCITPIVDDQPYIEIVTVK